MAGPIIRFATIEDIPKLLPLMRGLAEFERYADFFSVTEDTLAELGFRRSPPAFESLVAEVEGAELAGMLVFYIIPFTARAKPTFYIKELFIRPENRGQRIGEALMRYASVEAARRGCALMKWQVADWNSAAASFYTRLGATSDPTWIDYSLDADAIAALAASEPVDGAHRS